MPIKGSRMSVLSANFATLTGSSVLVEAAVVNRSNTAKWRSNGTFYLVTAPQFTLMLAGA